MNYRDAFFGSDISRDVYVRWDADVVNEMAVTDFTTEDGELVMVEIRLNPVMRFESKVYKFTLLHEMVHVKLYPYRFHGKKFDQEMLRLACAGAFNSIW